MKMPCIRTAAMLCIAFMLNACGVNRVADDVFYAPAEQAPSPDLPAAMSLMQSQGTYADLAELRHYSAYNAFHSAMSSSGTSGGNAVSATPAPAACFGNQ